VGKATYVAAAVMAAFYCLSGVALADEMVVKRKAARKAVVDHSSVVRAGCPDPYSCNSLYGAYGPYGGRAYWTRYVYSGWYR
jgi:hypothetical protein